MSEESQREDSRVRTLEELGEMSERQFLGPDAAAPQLSTKTSFCPFCGHDVVPTMKKVLFDPWRRVCGVVDVKQVNPRNIIDYDRSFQDGFHCSHCKLHFDEMPPAFLDRKSIPPELHVGYKASEVNCFTHPAPVHPAREEPFGLAGAPLRIRRVLTDFFPG